MENVQTGWRREGDSNPRCRQRLSGRNSKREFWCTIRTDKKHPCWREICSPGVRLRLGSLRSLSFARLMLGNPVISNTSRRFGACSSRNARSAMPSIAVPSKGRITGNSRLRSRLVAARFISEVAKCSRHSERRCGDFSDILRRGSCRRLIGPPLYLNVLHRVSLSSETFAESRSYLPGSHHNCPTGRRSCPRGRTFRLSLSQERSPRAAGEVVLNSAEPRMVMKSSRNSRGRKLRSLRLKRS
jgi:hypothetical protein